MIAGFVLDGLIAVLLVATIAYCVVLNRRLVVLRASHGEFVKLIESFNAATGRAEASIARLREIGEEKGATLDDRVEAARAICDDLAFLVERGTRIADRLEGANPGERDTESKAARLRATIAPGEAEDEAEDDGDDGTQSSKVERDLARAIQGIRGG